MIQAHTLFLLSQLFHIACSLSIPSAPLGNFTNVLQNQTAFALHVGNLTDSEESECFNTEDFTEEQKRAAYHDYQDAIQSFIHEFPNPGPIAFHKGNPPPPYPRRRQIPNPSLRFEEGKCSIDLVLTEHQVSGPESCPSADR